VAKERYRCKLCGEYLLVDEWSDEDALCHLLVKHPRLLESLVDYIFEDLEED